MFYRGIETRPIYRDVWVWGTGKTRKVIDRYDKIYQLVESMDEAKPFRKLSQAKAIGEKLNRHYSGITKIEIIDQGGKRVYS